MNEPTQPRQARVAILISGHMRTFDRCLPTLHWHVFRLFPGADFFVSTIADGNAAKANLLREKYPEARVEIEVVPAQPELPLPPGPKGWKLGSYFGHEPYCISVHPQAILRQLWQLQRCWELMASKHGDKNVHPYDIVIRCRPDLYFHSFQMPAFAASLLEEPAVPGEDRVDFGRHASTPWWGRFGGVNDRFAILGGTSATAYFTAFERIPDLMAAGCPLHPESLVRAALEFGGAHIDTRLLAEFSTAREDGTLRSPEATLADQVHLCAAKDDQP